MENVSSKVSEMDLPAHIAYIDSMFTSLSIGIEELKENVSLDKEDPRSIFYIPPITDED